MSCNSLSTELTVRTTAFSVAIQAATTIVGPATAAWGVLEAFDRYPRWNPLVTSMAGPLTEGSRVDVTLALPGLKPRRMRPRIVEVVPGRSFTWLGSIAVRGLLDGRHRFEVRPIDEASCELVQSEELTGLLVPCCKGLLTGPTPEGFAALNEALKEQVEHG